MKFRCERDTLVEILTVAGRATSSRGGAPAVYGCLRMLLSGNQLTVDGTDLDLTITAQVTVAGDEDGEALIPAKLAADIVRALDPGAVDLATEGLEAIISQDRSQFSVNLMAVEEFRLPPEPTAEPVVIDAGTFAEGLKQVVKAASNDESRPILTGVLLAAEETGLRLVATDSFRLAVRDLPGVEVLETDQRVLVPSRALKEVERLLGPGEQLTVTLGERDAVFGVGDIRLSTRLIEDKFPDYRSLIPASQPNRATVGREDLIEAVKRVKLMAKDGEHVRLHLESDTIRLEAVARDVGRAGAAVDAKYEGVDMTVGFNPDYLIDGLEVAPGDEVTIEVVEALKPALIRSTESGDFVYLLMPVRVS